jgi:hypothetical protein
MRGKSLQIRAVAHGANYAIHSAFVRYAIKETFMWRRNSHLPQHPDVARMMVLGCAHMCQCAAEVDIYARLHISVTPRTWECVHAAG